MTHELIIPNINNTEPIMLNMSLRVEVSASNNKTIPENTVIHDVKKTEAIMTWSEHILNLNKTSSTISFKFLR